MNVLVIGYGSIGKKHINILGNFKAIKNIEVITSQNIQSFKSFKKISDTNLNNYDYIIVASPTYKHFTHLKYIEKNCKNKTILVEKPIFLDNQRLSIKNNTVLVAYNLRYTKILQKIKTLISDQTVLYINIYTGSYLPSWRNGLDYSQRYSAKREQGGGVLLDLSHEIDYLMWLFGNFKQIKSINKKISNLNIDTDDIASFITTTKNNSLVSCTIDYISKIPKRQLIIHTNEFTLEADMIRGYINTIYEDGKIKQYNFKNDISNSYINMHKNIIKKQFKNICTFKDSIKVLKTIERIRNNG